MKTSYPKAIPSSGFSLVEITVAIGIFAFVAVGILGLIPAALKIRNDSALDTRAAMIAEELFSSVRSSPSITNVVVRVGPRNITNDLRYTNLISAPVVIGYPIGTTVPFWVSQNPVAAWTNANASDAEVKNAVANDNIMTMARLQASKVNGTTNLYRLTVDVRSPAARADSNSSSIQFSTLYFENP